MDDAESSEPSTGDRIETLIASYLQAIQSGQAPDRQRIIDENPDLTDELKSFFVNHDRMRAVADLGAAASPSPSPNASLAPTLPCDGGPAGNVAARFFDTKQTSDMTHPPAAAKTASEASQEFRRFGEYELLEEIDRGGMGVVYKARQIGLNRIVALKMIKSGNLASGEEVRRFYSEAKAAASLDHPGVVPIYEVGECDGLHYFSMKFIDGANLAAKLEDGPLSPRQAAILTRKLAQAVAHAHSKGVIHRDLKPENVLLDSDNEPKITDFGLAKNLRGANQLTATGQILGTPAYMSPEQAAGTNDQVNELADVYALGAILYALCTGQAPFTATNPLNVILNVLDSEPMSPSSLNRELPKPLERICMRCLEKRPVNRYESATQLADDLQRFLKDEPLQSQRQDVWQGLRRWSRREPALVAHLCGILVVLVIIQIAHRVLASDFVYHYSHVYVLCVWMAVSYLFQKLMKVPRWETTARLTWVCADVLLFTAILYMAEPPRGPLLIGYPLLVTASGLFFRVRFVAFTTVISVAASFVLVVVSREEAVMAHYRFLFAAGLTVLGCIVAAQVRRVRALGQYYEGRN